eukprot:6367580-Prorocentrum_lima.AAC.1
MMQFLKTEYGEAQLEFYLAAQQCFQLPPDQGGQQAMQVYNQFLLTGGSGIGQQERTGQTQQVWDYVNTSGGEQIDPPTALQKVREEADSVIKMLAFDAFPRFLKSKYCGA